MKFSLFTEIQCPSGAAPDIRLNEFLEQAELGDRLGFYGFWIAEIHCQPRFSLLSAPYVVLGAAAQRTRRLRLGVAVNTLPIHHPVSLAEQAAMLDLVSQGRMEFAAGGGHPHSRAYECFGADHKSTHDIMAEGLEVIRRAWSEETLTFQGKFFQIPEVVINPKPVQRPLPPFYMATSSIEGVEVGARLGTNLLLPIHTRTPEQVIEFANAYWDGLKEKGHDPRTRELGLLVPVHLARTTAEAKARSEDGVMSYFKTIADMRVDYTAWLTRRGDELPARLKTAAGAVVNFETVCSRHAVIGDSEVATAALREWSRRTGASHFLTWHNIGSVPHVLVKESMEQFAREVMPRL
ncbi:MAG TPA: LLM class flavin-dependent oxidoreductase [Candidatus Binatia bacterium]|jgi:alkanesulfonate monooxygenase SsuD/methylene tetrahydromethanopterin reductase-like flavin-dependent oxidoreductase (luciferase family)